VSTISELQQALRGLSATELESIADWLDSAVEESRYRAFHVREAQAQYSQEPLFMSWEEYLTFEGQSPYRHEYVNGTVYAMSGASLAHNRIAQELVVAFCSHLRGGPCEPFFLEAKLEIRAGSDRIMYYPDVMVSCRPEDRTDQVVTNPDGGRRSTRPGTRGSSSTQSIYRCPWRRSTRAPCLRTLKHHPALAGAPQVSHRHDRGGSNARTG
jgi:hypothetical protein